jgi:two-component system response regulator NreC
MDDQLAGAKAEDEGPTSVAGVTTASITEIGSSVEAEGRPGEERPIEVIIADDHAVVRDGLRTVLEREPNEFRVVGEAADVPAIVREVKALKPDLLTLDLTMPGGSCLAALPQCFIAHPDLTVVVVTMREDPGYARQALRAGVRGYVLKEAEPAELLHAFRMAIAGGQYLDPQLGAVMASGEGGQRGEAALSDREREVVRLVALGYTNPEIAERLHLGERTVKTYRARAVEKIGVSSRAELTAYARREGLIEDPIGISERLGRPPVLP